MRVGDRIAERRRAIGFSQTRLAREAGVSQGTIGKLEAGISSGSSQLHRIARVLSTTAEYLTGEIDDPNEGAPPRTVEPTYQFVSMPMAFPNEDALARMFEGLLLPLDLNQPRDELARTLAKRLPIGLAQLRDLLPRSASAEASALAQAAPPPAPDRRGSPRAPRT